VNLKRHLKDVVLALILKDNVKARVLNADGIYQRVSNGSRESCIQQSIAFRRKYKFEFLSWFELPHRERNPSMFASQFRRSSLSALYFPGIAGLQRKSLVFTSEARELAETDRESLCGARSWPTTRSSGLIPRPVLGVGAPKGDSQGLSLRPSCASPTRKPNEGTGTTPKFHCSSCHA